MQSNTIITALFSLIVAVGGIIGYAAAGSTASLAMGLVFALLLAFSAYRIHKKQSGGEMAAFALSAILVLFFTFRFFLSLKFMPAGLMAIISLVAAICLSPYSKNPFRR